MPFFEEEEIDLVFFFSRDALVGIGESFLGEGGDGGSRISTSFTSTVTSTLLGVATISSSKFYSSSKRDSFF